MNSKKALLGSCLAFLLVGALAGYLYGADSTPTKTTTAKSTTMVTTASSSMDAYDQVASSFANHMVFLSSGNASAVESQYESNASVTWMGDVFPSAGTYNVTNAIFLLMNDTFISGHGNSLTLGNVTLMIADKSADSAAVNSSFAFFEASSPPQCGFPFDGTVSAQDSYAYSVPNGAWLISREMWDFHITYHPCVYG